MRPTLQCILFVHITRDQLEEYVWAFRNTFADRPFWLFLGLFVASLAIHRGLRRISNHRASDISPSWLSGSLGGPMIALLPIAAYVSVMCWYVWQEAYYDFAEPTIAAVAWMFQLGHPVYHASDAAERYSHMYGPIAFMLPGWFLAIAGPGVSVSKAAGGIAGLLTLAFVNRLLRSATDRRTALLLTGVFALVVLMYRNVSFWVRPDSFVLLFTSASLLAATVWRRWVAAIAVGVSAGLLVNLKITGVFYALPAVGLLVARFGLLPLGVSAAVAGVTALVPFALFENISLHNYLFWIRTSASNGLLFTSLRENAEWALFLLIPLAPTLLASPGSALPRDARRLVYGTLFCGVAGVAIAAAKPGAGPDHLMPFWPVVIHALALHVSVLPPSVRADRFYRIGCVAFAMAVAAIAAAQQAYFVSVTRLTADIPAVNDLTQLVRAHPGRSIAMGFGYGQHGERLTFVRPVLVFQTGSYLIDAPAVQEYQLSGMDLPAATIEAVRSCHVDIWVLPISARPFEGPNKYPMTGYTQLFPESFKQAFFAHYRHTGDTRYFQIWTCREPASR